MSQARELLHSRVPLDQLPLRDWAAAGAELERDGVVRLQGALGPEAMAKVEAAVDRSLANPSPHAVSFYPNEPARFFEDRGSKQAGLVREVGVDTMMRALWGVDRVWYMGEQLFLKDGGEARRTPWHQDTSYLRMMGSQLVACWISLDALPKDHCLEFVRGSHKGVLYNGSAFAAHDDTAPLYKQSRMPRLPDIQADRDHFDIVSWDVEPRDILVFHLGTLHGGAGTAAGLRRRTVSLRFMGPDVVFDGRPRDELGAQAGNDAAMATVYAGLGHGDRFPTGHMPEL